MVAHLPLQRYRCIIFDTRGSGSNAATYAHCMLHPTLSATLFLSLIFAVWPRRRVSLDEDRDFTLERLADDVIGLADALGISQFSFVGHSMGGGIGMLLALLHPQRVKRCVRVRACAMCSVLCAVCVCVCMCVACGGCVCVWELMVAPPQAHIGGAHPV